MTIISARAHLGDKNLISAIIPTDVVNIEDWAYANCKNLHEIWIPVGCKVSNKAFIRCNSLSSVHLYQNEYETPANSYPHLLGLAIRTWCSDTDILISQASEDDGFLKYFDDRLIRYLNEPDDKGFKPFLAGGEEDYADEDDEYERYVNLTRRNKILLIYERLSYILLDHRIYNVEYIYNAGITKETAPTDRSYPDHADQAFVDYLHRLNPHISFGILTDSNANAESYRRIYFDLSLDKDVDPEILLGMAGQDTALRAMIIEHRSSMLNDRYIL